MYHKSKEECWLKKNLKAKGIPKPSNKKEAVTKKISDKPIISFIGFEVTVFRVGCMSVTTLRFDDLSS